MKIRHGTSFVWFFDALSQFIHFNQIRCPNCGKEFEAPEARLFGIFKSPITIIALAILFDVLLLAYAYIFHFRN